MTKKLFSHTLPFGTRNNLLSLFVGAAIAGSVFSSSHAEITVSEQAREELFDLNFKRLGEFWGEMNEILEVCGVRSDLRYDEKAKRQDAQVLCDAICKKDYGFSLISCSSEDPSSRIFRKSFLELVDGTSERPQGKAWLYLFRRDVIGVFLKCRMCDVVPDLWFNFKNLPPDQIENFRNCIKEAIRRLCKKEGSALETDYDPFCESRCKDSFELREQVKKLLFENSFVFMLAWDCTNFPIPSNYSITSFFAEKFFSDDYIEKVQDILIKGCFPSRVMNEIKFRISRFERGDHPLQTILLVKFTQVRKDYLEAKDTGSPEAKEKFRKSALFVGKFCLINRRAGLLSPKLREFILEKIWDMQKKIKKL